MTDQHEETLRRALDDVLTVCWTHDIPLLDAITESIEEWTAIASAEFNESRPFEGDQGKCRLATAISTLTQATPTTSTKRALSQALADWVTEIGRA